MAKIQGEFSGVYNVLLQTFQTLASIHSEAANQTKVCAPQS